MCVGIAHEWYSACLPCYRIDAQSLLPQNTNKVIYKHLLVVTINYFQGHDCCISRGNYLVSL